MTDTGFVIACSGYAMATGATCVLLCRCLRSAHKVPTLVGPMPWFLSCLSVPGAMLAPGVRRLLSAAWFTRLEGALAQVELERSVSPELWVAIRFLHGLLAGLAAAMAALFLSGDAPLFGACGFACGYSAGGLWLRKARNLVERHITRDLPSYLDLLTVCVEAGATLTAGINHVIGHAPDSPLRRYFEHVLREVRGGQPRAQAFQRVATLYAVPSLSSLAAALTHAETSGMSLGEILRAQGQQRTAERFARAEQRAMQAPVKLLGPLILCIFPCTFIVLAVPIFVRLTEAFAS
jgi:tight adherence protein C